jgi:hypothetical protein
MAPIDFSSVYLHRLHVLTKHEFYKYPPLLEK